MKHKVSELEGALLDAAVAKAEGRELLQVGQERAAATLEGAIARVVMAWAPSTNWQHGGQIIEREHVSLYFEDYGPGAKCWVASAPGNDETYAGPTPLIAAMRALIAAKFGEEVDI